MRVDLIVRNGRIDTRDPERPEASAIAVLGGRIVAIDDLDGLEARETIDARGLAVLPGFNDVHAHSVWFGTTLMEADLSGVASLDDIYDRIAAQAAETADGEWVVAAGYNPVLLGGAVPDRDRLDAASGGRPVWIKHASGHSGQASSAALELAGVDDARIPEVEGGLVVVADGRATGVLEERAMELVQRILLPYPLASIERALELATAQYAREGLTSVTDAGVAGGWIGHAPGELAAYQSARDRGLLSTRMQVMPVMDALAGFASHDSEPALRGLGAGMRTGWGDEWLQLGPVKVFTDGSILGRTAQMSEDYEGCPGYHGYLQDDPDAMRARIVEAAAAGWSLALHAVGDAALDFALDAIEAGAQARGGAGVVPDRVEHGTVVRPEQLSRLASLGVACVTQPSFIPTFGDGIRGPMGEARVELALPARRQLDAGLPLAFSSDRPVAPGMPLLGIQAFVERVTEGGRDFSPAERISVDEAVEAATVGSAAVTGQSASKGRIALGQLADLVLLEAHPREVPVADIAAIGVRGTIAGGRWTHRDGELS